MKKLSAYFSFFLILFLMVGCQGVAADSNPIKEVTLKAVNSNDSSVINDKETMDLIESIIDSKVKIDGTVNMTDPDFYLDVTYSDDSVQNYSLWVDENTEKLAIQDKNDDEKVYSVSNELTEEFKSVIEKLDFTK